MAQVAFALPERGIDAERVFADQVGDDGFAVADRLAVVDDVGKLAARRRRGVEDVLVHERQADEPQEGEHLQAVAVVIGNAEQRGIGVERDHGVLRGG